MTASHSEPISSLGSSWCFRSSGSGQGSGDQFEAADLRLWFGSYWFKITVAQCPTESFEARSSTGRTSRW